MRKKRFRELGLKNFYHGPGEAILKEFVLPALSNSESYDRLTGYFNIAGLVGISSGLEELFRNAGNMRLVIGLHDVPRELLASLAVGDILPEEVIEDYKKRLIEDIGFLKSETEKSCLVAVAWMIRLGYLRVVVAAPRTTSGIFHQKRMIFRDSFGDVIAGTGSLNETQGGQRNSEEMYFQFSWQTVESAWRPFLDDFEAIWNNASADVVVRALDATFASEILERLGNAPNPFRSSDQISLPPFGNNTMARILDFARNSLSLAALNSSNAVLYPHQERVFIDALRDFPVRKLIGDEVGLGKTLEAGAVIAHLVKTHQAKNVVVLAPAGLMNQWLQEMSMHFSLKFWRWDSASLSYLDSTGSRYEKNSGSGQKSPNLRIISSQWARVNPQSVTGLEIDLLVVDEAHAARLHRDAYGIRKTKLWRLLQDLSNRVPNILLLTATPMQTDPIEFHGLLQILGLNDYWNQFSNYERSLNVLTSSNEKPTLQGAMDLFKMISNSISNLRIEDISSSKSKVLLREIIEMQEVPSAQQAIFIQQRFADAKSLLIEVHPGHRLIVRNTKSGLERFGYRFPERKFVAPAVTLKGTLETYERMIESYLSEAYGRVEEALAGESGTSMGFAKSTYYQRLVSSLVASATSLHSRRDKLKEIQRLAALGDTSILKSLPIDNDDFDEIDIADDFEITQPTSREIEGRLDTVVAAAQTEIAYIGDLLERLVGLNGGIAANDPKFQVCLRLIEELSASNQILVFSKYTDTIDAFVEYFQSSSVCAQVRGIALYTGKSVWINEMGVTRDASKSEVTMALAHNQIRIVFCSDAASEGLNLQSARIIINLDVPWNPARLEQRIGRIARLGQKADEVEIINLWYPRSIEARMYQRLLERRQDYQVAVGEFPEIFAKAISREIGISLGDHSNPSIDPTALLSEIRGSVQRRALEKLWSGPDKNSSISSDFRDALRTALISPPITLDGVERLSAQPGLENSLSLNSSQLDGLIGLDLPQPLHGAYSLDVVRVRDRPIALCVSLESKVIALIKTIALPAVISTICNSQPLNLESYDLCSNEELPNLIKSSLGPWTPNVPLFESNENEATTLSFTLESIGSISLSSKAGD